DGLIRVWIELELGGRSDLACGTPSAVHVVVARVSLRALAIAVAEHRHPVILPRAVAPQRVETAAQGILLGEHDGVAGAVGEGPRQRGAAVHVVGGKVAGFGAAEDLVIGAVAAERPAAAPGLPRSVVGIGGAVVDLDRGAD